MKKFISCFFIFFAFQATGKEIPLESVIKKADSPVNAQTNHSVIPKKTDQELLNTINGDENRQNNFSNLSIKIESAFSMTKNNLLNKNYSWSVEIPHMEITANYKFSKNTSLEIGFDFSYQAEVWSYSIEEAFIQRQLSFFTPLYLQLGYFIYPPSYIDENLKAFSKKTLVYQNLFNTKDRDIGASLKVPFEKHFYAQISLQSFINEKERSQFQFKGHPVLSASLIYENLDQNLFAGYLQKESFFEGKVKALGTGSRLSYKINSWTLGLKGEFWNISKNKPKRNILTYYIFPHIQWKRWTLGALLGGAYHYLNSKKTKELEYLLKGEFCLTKNLHLSIERLKESDSIIKQSAWIFSLRANFEM